MNIELLAKAKSLGFSDRPIGHLMGTMEDAVRTECKWLEFAPCDQPRGQTRCSI